MYDGKVKGGRVVMPFTSYHLGISLSLGYLLRRRLNWPTLILSSVIIDLEPLIIMVIGLNYPLHGLLHTFLASIPVGALIGFILYLVREQIAPYLVDLALVDKEDPPKSFISAGIMGWASHVFFDSTLYPEMKPFYPLNFNPLFQPEFDQIIFQTYALLFLAGVLIYPAHLYRTLSRESEAAAKVSVGLVSVGLGAITISAGILYYVSFPLIATGFLMLAYGLKRMLPCFSKRIFSSFMILTIAASLIYLADSCVLGLTLEQCISGLYSLGFSTIFMVSYALSLMALAVLWPVLKLLQRDLRDHVISLSLNLLIAGLILAPLLIPLLIAALSYVIVVIKIPHKLKLREKTSLRH